MTNPAFQSIFDDLRSTMLGAVTSHQHVDEEAPGRMVLKTRTRDAQPASSAWFGMVEIKKSYVSYHLMPLYDQPELGADLSPDLLRRKQGKTCFNFKREDPALYPELAKLTAKAAQAVSPSSD